MEWIVITLAVWRDAGGRRYVAFLCLPIDRGKQKFQEAVRAALDGAVERYEPPPDSVSRVWERLAARLEKGTIS